MMFPQGGAIVGRRIRAGEENPWWRVVGIAADVRAGGPNAPIEPEYYTPRTHDAAGAAQRPSRGASLIFGGTSGNHIVTALPAAVRAEVAALDPAVPVTVEPLARRYARLTDRPRFHALLLAIFAGAGVVLAAIGLYGMVAFHTAQRAKELAVRVALGARPGQVVRLVVGETAAWIGIGAAVGLVGAWFGAAWLRSLLFGVAERDPLSIGLAVMVLVVCAAVAAWVPARRAAAADPNRVLRSE
jgi:hypothetical protein